MKKKPWVLKKAYVYYVFYQRCVWTYEAIFKWFSKVNLKKNRYNKANYVLDGNLSVSTNLN